MNPIEFLFKLLLKFGAIEAEKFPQLREQGIEWYSKIHIDKESNESSENKKPEIIRRVKAFSEQWYGQVTWAILYILMVRWIWDFMNPQRDDLED